MSGRIMLYTMLVASMVGTVFLVGGVTYTPAQGEETKEVPVTIHIGEPDARAWGVFDVESGTLLAGEDTDTPHPIASVTKLFTAYVVSESEREEEAVTITWSDLNTEGDSGKLTYGDETTLGALLFPLLIESSNDAGTAIGRALGDSFTETLGTLRDELTLTETHITEPTGLSPTSVSSVEDLARFYAHLRHTHAHILDITTLRTYVREDHGLVNNDPAHAIETFTGGKHGYTPEAGKTFVGTFMVREAGLERELGIVLLGSRDIVQDITAILGPEYTNVSQ